VTALGASAAAFMILGLFEIFSAALVVRVRGDRWLPRWAREPLRAQISSSPWSAATVLWMTIICAATQGLVVVQAFRWINEGQMTLALIFLLELLIAVSSVAIALRVASRQPPS
jgi:hypothetical protein